MNLLQDLTAKRRPMRRLSLKFIKICTCTSCTSQHKIDTIFQILDLLYYCSRHYIPQSSTRHFSMVDTWGVFWWIIRRDGWFDADLCFERIIIHRYEIIFSGIQCPKMSLLRLSVRFWEKTFLSAISEIKLRSVPFVFDKKCSCRWFLMSLLKAFRSFRQKTGSVGE